MRLPKKLAWPRPQFSLATFLVAVTLISPGFGYLAHHRSWNTKRINARANLHSQGFRFEWRRPDPMPTTFKALLNRLLLEDEYESDYAYSRGIWAGAAATGHAIDLTELRYFPELRTLYLGDGLGVTDEDLKIVAQLPNLKHLEIVDEPVSGEFLQSLPANSPLESLRFEGLTPSPAGLLRLRTLKHLKRLEICSAPRLTDPSMREVQMPPSLEELTLVKCGLSDETVARWLSNCKLRLLTLELPITRRVAGALASQTQLEEFHLQSAPLIDDDIAFLLRCNGLRKLTFRDVPIQGEVLLQLSSLKQLRQLILEETLVSPARQDQLSTKAGLPLRPQTPSTED